MRTAILMLSVAIGAMTMTSCGKNHLKSDSEADLQQSITTRAATLGYDNAEEYVTAVSHQCANGNHVNCDVCDNGTHTPCADCDHEGMHRNGNHKGYGNHYGWEKGKHYGWENCSGNGNGNCSGNGNGNGNCSGNGNGNGNCSGNGNGNGHGNGTCGNN